METFEVNQPVVVYEGSGNTRRRHDGVITKVGRTLVTIEWCWQRFGHAEVKQFRMEDQRENLPASRTYSSTPSFRTLEQDARVVRMHAAEDGLVRVGLAKRGHGSVSLEEMEAVVNLLDDMRKTP